MAKNKVILNNIDALQILVQETYDLTKKQIKQAQDELSTLATACPLKDKTADEIAKICKAKKDYMDIIDKNVAKLHDINKLMSDIVKYQGKVDEALEENEKAPRKTSLDIRGMQKQIKEMTTSSETYNIR